MAAIDGPLELTAGDETHARQPLGSFRRPTSTTGWRSWFVTVDHKKIGIMYGAAALVFLGIGGLEALLIRAQLAQPNGQVLSPEAYNQAFTLHGTTMIFFVVMPLLAAFSNYLIPLQIGARDVAFPRLNALSFWIFITAGLFVYSGVLMGHIPDNGWFNYAPNSGLAYSPGHGIDFWDLGLQIAGIASLVGAVNLIVTCLNMRAPGMTLMRMPIFTWMALVSQFLLLFAIPVITVALFLLMFDRLFGGNFFVVKEGADPLLWQHLFWIFGHPEVYILVLPAFGIVSEVIPVFARKPLFGYPFMVFSGIAIGFMGWGVWAHHMFASGAGPVTVAAFSLSTMFIAVPTGVKIFNWVGTLWGGKLRFTAAMMFAVALVSQFTIGGLSGVTHAVAPADTQQTDTYYIVAHFHYVLFGGSMFGIFSGLYFYWPKIFGRFLSERLGKLHFWLWFVGFNLTFGPMHILGLQGQPRRTSTYAAGMGWDLMNLLSTIGSFIIAIGFLVFVYNVVASRKNVLDNPDPWDARTLEWGTSSPPPAHNYDVEPTATHLDEWWHRKYETDERGKLRRRETIEYLSDPNFDASSVHLPSPSYWPIIVAAGLPLIAYGLIFTYWLAGLGGVLVIGGIFGWGFEPSVDPDAGHGHDHDPGHDDGPAHEPEPVAVGVGAEES
ncbi:MAG: putative cytochrome c oxidase subunit I/subunit [Actinomycetia bacterium]|jgi:cytochrome c oxidase subunit 1|nr:putative cytochrome c oxidase subunit I/subunit [Actinomycetes bacterium]